MFIGLEAPEINSSAILEDNSFTDNFVLSEYFNGSYGVIFFYAMNFSYICPTELIAINNRIQEFNNRDTKVVAISTDTHFSHRYWKNTTIENGGIGNIEFPLVADITKEITEGYGVLLNKAIAMRATFIVDQDMIVRYQQINDLPIGRDIDSIINFIDALQFHNSTGYVCPAGWSIDKNALLPNEDSLKDFLKNNSDNL